MRYLKNGYAPRPISYVLVCLFLVGGCLVGGCMICRGEMETSIGSFDSRDTGTRSALRELAKEVASCPRAELYRVIWASPNPEYPTIDRQAILYDRPHKRLGYERDIYSGISGKAYIVDDSAIRIVAERGGSLESFVEFDQSVESGKQGDPNVKQF